LDAMSSQEEQLIELLLTLKKTTPDQARAILSSTPQIAYALMSLMVKMNAIDVQVLQKTLTSYSANMPPPSSRAGVIQPASAVPPHLSQYRTPTPQTQVHTPPLYNGHGRGHTPPSVTPAGTGGYMAQNHSQAMGAGAGAGMGMGMGTFPDALAAIPDEQKAMIMRVISMTPEQVSMLPPTERASIVQLRTTLGLPS
ncbi:hypothetical protein F5I97DRAFT_1809457, partial [Phlebopus sp. FC_14]